MGWMLRGLALALSSGTQVTGLPLSDPFFEILGGGKVVGIPVSVWLLGLIVIVLTIVMRQTPFGFRVREIGSNPDAAEFSGIPIRRTKTMGFMLAALMAGIAGVVGVAFFTSGDPQSGGGIELYAVAGAVIGGTPLAGGKATVFGAVMGAILLTAVSVGLVYFQIPGRLESVRHRRRHPRRGVHRRPRPASAPPRCAAGLTRQGSRGAPSICRTGRTRTGPAMSTPVSGTRRNRR